MAGEIQYSTLGDLRLSETLSAEVLMLLADRAFLGNHPALMYLGDLGGSPSLTKKISQLGWNGYDALADVAEGSSVVNTAFTDASATVVVSRRAKAYIHSELAAATDIQGLLTRPSFAMDAATSAAMKLTSLIANVTDDFTAQAGATTVDLNASDLITAHITLEIANANVGGGVMCILHPQQWGDVQQDILAAGGTLAETDTAQASLQLMGSGYKGNFFGIDIFTSNQVPTATSGADRAGGMFTRGAVAWADATPASDGNPLRQVIGKILLGTDYDSKAGETTTTQSYFCGVSQVIDAAGVTILSDA